MKRAFLMKPVSILLIMLVVPLIMCCRQTNESTGHEGNSVISRVQEPFDIQLEGCPTCGYTWFLEPFDSTALRLLSHSITPLNRNKGAVGGNALEVWNLTGLRKGEFQLIFRYKRPWLDEIEKTEQFRVRIR